MEDKKKIKIYYGLLITLVVFMGVSYAWFRLKLTQTNSNVIGTRTCLDASLTEDTSKITLSDAFPISDEDGLKQTPFTFTLKNNCDSYVKVYITIDSKYRTSTDAAYLKDSFLKVNLSSKGTTDGSSVLLGGQTLTDLDNNKKGYIIVSTGLKANEEKSYDLRIWMDSAVTTEQGLNKNWSGKIVVVSTAAEEPAPAPNGWYDAGSGTLLAALRDGNTLKTPITTPGAAISTASEALLASAEDDYGTSYYFRGKVINNYVEFANKCWRIVRINGEGSVKLVLHNDNTSKVSNPCSSANNSINAAFARYSGTIYSSPYNSYYNDNAYVGFMYGQAGASDYTSTHANTNKSDILKNLEKWYTNNLSSYESKLADTIWCNDKSTFSKFKGGSTYGTGLGYGTNQTGYGVYNKLYGGYAASYASPSLICPNDNNGGKLSKFTVDDTTNGNGDLTYKIGLLTADEIAFAGSAYGAYNLTSYLLENANAKWWWALSPSYFNNSRAEVWVVDSMGLYSGNVNGASSLRPAISLVSDTEISGGSGTSEDPYVVK